MSLSYEQSVLMKEYLSQRTMAVVGASNEREKFGNLACRELKARGLRVFRSILMRMKSAVRGVITQSMNWVR